MGSTKNRKGKANIPAWGRGSPGLPAGGISRRAALAGLSSLALTAAGRAQTPGATPRQAQGVDLLLVLAVDASGSVSMSRFALQQQGYVKAFRHPRVLQAIRSGMLGAIGVTMVQWTGPHLHVIAVPWTRVSDKATLEGFASAIEKSPRDLFGGGTSISGAIDFAATLFPKAPWKAARKVVDVSGDGYNSSGRGVHEARDEAVKAGIVINGLPILSLELDLDKHYAEDVIGGPGAFSIPAANYDKFAEAIQRKLILEIAAREPPRLPRG
ncbi:MAG: DUF1194 domain-containing protein [Beijerinckiaceae bacterium]